VAGAGFYLLVLAIVSAPIPATALIIAVGINALGWDIGFLAFLTPSGVGFREAAIVGLLLLSGLVPAGAAAAGLALVIAVIARLMTTGSELLCVSLAYLARGGTPLPTPENDSLPVAESESVSRSGA
jgi:glycosyltransferase 2 family protein